MTSLIRNRFLHSFSVNCLRQSPVAPPNTIVTYTALNKRIPFCNAVTERLLSCMATTNIMSPKLTPIILNTNVKSLIKKMSYVERCVQAYEVDLACITETWLHSGIPNEKVHIDGYSCIRRDREVGKGGGVICYVSNTFIVKRREDLNERGFESIWMSVHGRKAEERKTLIVGAIYHPPRASGRKLFNHACFCLDSMLEDTPGASVVILGDLNRFNNKKLERAFGLKQIVDVPTYKKKVLDKVLTDRNATYERPLVFQGIPGADHRVVICTPRSSPRPIA